MQTEQLLPIHKFDGVDPQTQLEAQIIEGLRIPTELVANWYVNSAPPYFHYDKTYKGVLDNGPLQAAFRKEYLSRAQGDSERGIPGNPLIRHRHYMLGEDWQPIPIVEDPKVKGVISKIIQPLPDIARMIQSSPGNENYLEFADYLMEAHRRLPAGEFDQLMVTFLNQSKANILWLAMPVEYRGDPMGDKTAPQGLLAYIDRNLTDDANQDLLLFNKASERRYGQRPFPAWIFVANRIVASGDLALSNSPQSAFHIPNEPEIADIAKHTGIYIFQNSIDRLNEEVLAAGLFEVMGQESTTQQAIDYVKAHEVRHGKRTRNTHLGKMRTAVREGEAAAGAVLISNEREFSRSRLERVVMGMLTFAADDSKPFRRRILGGARGLDWNMREILSQAGGYGVDGVWVTRQLILRQAFNPKNGDPNIEEITALSQEREEVYGKLAESGEEQDAIEMITEELNKGERRKFIGERFYSDAEAAS